MGKEVSVNVSWFSDIRSSFLYKINIEKWKEANHNLNFDKLSSSQKSSIKKSGNIYIGTGINPSLGHRKIDLNVNEIKKLRKKNFTTEQMARLVQFTTGSSQLPHGGFAEIWN